MELLIILVLILLNGFFALAELAVVSARRSRLQIRAEKGSLLAKQVLAVQANPAAFLSTIQVGITSVAILSGAFGESLLAGPLANLVGGIPLLAPWASQISLVLVVLFITYLSVVIGELVPKRLALAGAERLAMVVVEPVVLLQRLAAPLVWLFSRSSDVLVALLRIRASDGPSVTNDDIRMMMAQGARAGVFHQDENALVSNVLRLDEQNVMAVLTPRSQIVMLDLADSVSAQRDAIAASTHSRILVCDGGRENVVGFVNTRDLLRQQLRGQGLPVRRVLREPLFVPDTVSLPRLLATFRRYGVELACVVDEYGTVIGLVTLADLMAALAGELPVESQPGVADMVPCGEQAWMVDGTMPLARFKDTLSVPELDEDVEGELFTVGGLALHRLGRLPVVGDAFSDHGLSFRVEAVDGARVARLRVSRGD